MAIDYENILDITDKQYQQAAEALAEAILNNKVVWDENLEHHRMDLLIDLERILNDDEDDKIGRMHDVQYETITAFSRYAVEFLPSYFDKYYEEESRY